MADDEMPHIDLPERTDNPTVLRLRRRIAERDARIASLESQLAEANARLEECVEYFEKLGWFEAAAKLRERERADG